MYEELTPYRDVTYFAMQSVRSFLVTPIRWVAVVLRRYWWLALALALVVSGLAYMMVPQVYWYASFGNADDYDTSFGECGRYDTTLRNESNLVATLRRVECTGGLLGPPPTRDYFVFVHSPHESNGAPNLVLRYRKGVDDPDWTIEPRVSWYSTKTLVIATGQLSSADFDLPPLARDSIDDVSITYVSGGVRVSPEYQFRRAPWTQFNPSGSFW